MRLILLGADGVGKTSLSLAFQNKGYVRYKDNMYAEKFIGNKDYVYYSNVTLFDFIEQADIKDIVLDRCFWDEFVYSVALNREFNKQDWERMLELDARIAKLDFKIVFMYKPNHIITGEHLITTEHLPVIERQYAEVYATTICSAQYLDSSSQDSEDQILKILN